VAIALTAANGWAFSEGLADGMSSVVGAGPCVIAVPALAAAASLLRADFFMAVPFIAWRSLPTAAPNRARLNPVASRARFGVLATVGNSRRLCQ